MITREFDTIAAISTPLGEGAIGIVRLSGTDSFDSKIPKSFLPHLQKQYQIFLSLVEEQKRLALLRKVQLNNKD